MDIRDVKDEVPCPCGEGFEKMWELQLNLVNHYIEIEKVPPPVWELDIKANQLLIKDFISRVIEELGEGFESYEAMVTGQYTPDRGYDYIPALQNFNEEIADAMHFMLEVSIFVGIEPRDIKEFLYSNCSRNLDWVSSDLLTYGLRVGREKNLSQSLRSFQLYQIPIPSASDSLFLRGGAAVSETGMEKMAVKLWNVTYSLQLARNSLKNKPWKQTQMRTDGNQFIYHMLNSWLKFFILLDFVGYDEESLFHIYFKKNKVNEFRIRSKY